MLKPNYKKLGLMAFAGFMTVGAIAPVASVHAATTGSTTVSFDNRTFVPGTSEYAFVIPTAITFDGEVLQKVNANFAVTGINGFELAKDWDLLQITASVNSKNDYKMLFANGQQTVKDKFASYQLSYNGGKTIFNTQTAPNTPGSKDPTFYKITDNLGVGKGMTDTVSGEAQLTSKSNANIKGLYKDTVTYKFTQVKAVKK